VFVDSVYKYLQLLLSQIVTHVLRNPAYSGIEGQYYSCWCHGCICCQDISRYTIEHMSIISHMHRMYTTLLQNKYITWPFFVLINWLHIILQFPIRPKKLTITVITWTEINTLLDKNKLLYIHVLYNLKCHMIYIFTVLNFVLVLFVWLNSIVLIFRKPYMYFFSIINSNLYWWCYR